MEELKQRFKYWLLMWTHIVTGKQVVDFRGSTYMVFGKTIKKIGEYK